MLIAQELLEKAIAIDPHYGQALGVLSASYTFGAHMGWADWKTSRRSPNALRWPRSAPTARIPGRIMRSAAFYLITRRFDDSLAEFELALRLNPNFSHAQNYYAVGAGLLRPLGGSRRGRAAARCG